VSGTSGAVQNLIQVRGRADVQSARLNSLDHEIQEQKAAAVRIGNDGVFIDVMIAQMSGLFSLESRETLGESDAFCG